MITKTAFFNSSILHVAIGIVLVVGVADDVRQSRPLESEVKSVNAVVVDNDVLVAEVARLRAVENREKIQKEKELKSLKRQLDKLRDRSNKEKNTIKGLQSEKDRISGENSKAQRKRNLELKKAADAKKQADEESKRLYRARKLREEAEVRKELTEREAAKAQRVLAEMELLAELSSEETSEEFAEQSRKDAELIDKYAAAIKERVLANYKILPGHEGLKCTLRIILIRDGNVAGVEIIRSSNSASFDRLAEVAVRKVAPFPVPESDRVFNKMKVISFVFRP